MSSPVQSPVQSRSPVQRLQYAGLLSSSGWVNGPPKVFWVIEILKGYGKLDSRVDTRLPITLPILRNIVQQTPSLCSSEYRAYLFQAMCTTAFFAFLRIGEITCCPRSPTVLQIDQVVKLLDTSGKIPGLKIMFANFKHSYNRPNVTLTLHRRTDICPVQSLLDYFACRGVSAGPLFRTRDGHAVSRKLFTDHLAILFRACGLDFNKYKGHSFRIGAATFAAECGYSDAQIRLMGRWKSDAFRKYIRGPSPRLNYAGSGRWGADCGCRLVFCVFPGCTLTSVYIPLC